jgi:GT2 family glycosyltransferase
LATNGGFGWANNQAILALSREAAPPDFIHLLNPDTEITEGALTALVDELQRHPRCGAAGSRLLTPDGRTAASAFRFPSPGREFIGAAQSEQLGRMLGISSTVVTKEESVEVDWVTGASVMFRAEALRTAGLFDDGFFLYFEEVELMHRLHASGWTVRHVPRSTVIHVEGASTGIGANAADRPHPAYWYQSRRRYFGLTGGGAAIVAANLSLLGGKAVATLKKLVGRPSASKACRTKDVLAQGIWPVGSDQSPSRPAWGDAPGRPPAWMHRQ